MLKKKLLVMLTLIVGIMLVFCFAACGNGNGNTTLNSNTALVGKWENGNPALPLALEFEADNTGKLGLFEFTYTVSGNTVNITFTASNQISSYTWSVSGNTLTLTGTGTFNGTWTKMNA